MKTRYVHRAIAAIVIALCATTTVVACGSDDSTGDGGVGAATGDDARAENSDEGNDSGDNDDNGGVPAQDVADSLESTLSSSGDTVEFTSGKTYEYDDGRTEFGDDAYTYSVKLDNLRKIDVMTEPDPDAPADHPDSKPQVESVMVCFDVTTKVVNDPNADDDSISLTASGLAPKFFKPLIQHNGKSLTEIAESRITPEVKAGEDHVVDYDNPLPDPDTDGGIRRAPSDEEIKEERKSDERAHCFTPDANGEETTSVPDDFTGFTVTMDPGIDTRPSWGVWDLKLED
ncbi:hypothetical protein [Corynebacterium sp.]|uniref:hypothetical protein n=1 Tax=Corynebacterium sp. TaxID=1720 RepID=UPI003B3A6A94